MSDETQRFEPPPDVSLADLHEPPRPAQGKHRSADTDPSTGPIYKIPMGPRGRHQEHDLEPKRWPWALLSAVLVVLTAWIAYAWGHGPVGALEAELATRPESPVETVTETVAPTGPSPRPQRAPQPTATVTVTKGTGKAPKAVPGPTVTRWSASPGPTVYRDRLQPGPTVYRTRERTVPGPTVTRTREVESARCFRVRNGVIVAEISCP